MKAWQARAQRAVESVLQAGESYGFALPKEVTLASGKRVGLKQRQKVVVDFSSVNIAKPLHAGHLRATIIGNFVVQINRAFGHEVVGVNFIGDWGRQFAMLLAGFEQFGNKQLLESNAASDQEIVAHLHSVYVRANEELPANCESVQAAHSQLEQLQPSAMRMWRTIRHHSISELNTNYDRMGISFDEFEFESYFARETPLLLRVLDQRGLLHSDSTGAKWISIDSKRVLVTKSDSSSLYFGRDLLAALTRAEKYKCDRIHYVVDSAQREHFHNLRRSLAMLGCERLADSSPWDFHVQFGRVEGMSSRRGGAILLREILDTGQELMLRRMQSSKNRRVDDARLALRASDTLAVTVIAMEMMRVKRQQGMKFIWERDNSGLVAQYCHARLCSLTKRATEAKIQPLYSLPSNQLFAISSVQSEEEIEAVNRLVEQLVQFPQVALDAYISYEPCLLVQFLNRHVSATNSAIHRLPVLACSSEVAAGQRLALLLSAKQVLYSCLDLLGLKALDAL